MDRYINATHLMTNIDTALAKLPPRGNAKSTQHLITQMTLCTLKQMVQEVAKEVEVKPIIHGHWIFKYGQYCCSECDHRSFDKEEDYWGDKNPHLVKWCPYCGALMDEPDEG